MLTRDQIDRQKQELKAQMLRYVSYIEASTVELSERLDEDPSEAEGVAKDLRNFSEFILDRITRYQWLEEIG